MICSGGGIIDPASRKHMTKSVAKLVAKHIATSNCHTFCWSSFSLFATPFCHKKKSLEFPYKMFDEIPTKHSTKFQ